MITMEKFEVVKRIKQNLKREVQQNYNFYAFHSYQILQLIRLILKIVNILILKEHRNGYIKIMLQFNLSTERITYIQFIHDLEQKIKELL
ncbi:unnamed protein product [Paramecium sonneborni]|uniref:Uncharacterized protein n=1 Tax=Paramecium sonneborni TaxID=65129 RepID=A0A8S1RIU8_9CILI|nr:unnamed protein product [Paramecium sonneborni]CAD8128441.1 unnamed protein product [Paramecium sonneborni]